MARTKMSAPRASRAPVRPRPPTDVDASLLPSPIRTRNGSDLTFLIRYYHMNGMCRYSTSTTLTVKQFIDLIRETVKIRVCKIPDWEEDPFLINDGAVFLYKGQDLCRTDPMMTLAEVGMVERVTILILYPGRFNEVVYFPENSKSFQLKAMAETVRKSVDAGIPMLQFLKETEGPAHMKIMKVVIPVSDATDLLFSVKINLTHPISVVKQRIRSMIMSCIATDDLGGACSRIGEFEIFLGNWKLDSARVLEDYPVREYSQLKVSPGHCFAKYFPWASPKDDSCKASQGLLN